MTFTDIKISRKLTIGFLVVVLLLGSAIGYQLYSLETLASLENEAAHRANDAVSVGTIQTRLAASYEVMADAIINRHLEQTEHDFAELKSQAANDLATIKKLADTPEEQADADQVGRTYSRYLGLFEKDMLPLLKQAGDNNTLLQIRDIDGKLDELREETEQNLERIVTSLDEEMIAAEEAFNATRAKAITVACTLSALGILFAALIGFFITHSITAPLRHVVEMINQLKIGCLPNRLQLGRKDEIGVLADALDDMTDNLQGHADIAAQIAKGNLNVTVRLASGQDQFGMALQTMAANLNELIGQIQVAGEQIDSASSQVSDSSQALSQGATETAASLEEISSSMSEMAAQTSQSAEHAREVNTLAGETSSAAVAGNQQMQAMIAAMGEINSAGQNISKIIKVIDEIAFQTNLLALNAAVEAARAGQHGKGFAVVAEEVRNLAARSAKAAKETAELIEGSVQKTANGTRIAEQTGKALEAIVGSIGQVTELAAEIAAASNEQAAGIGQVTQGLGQIDQTVQQNTATSEESAAAAEELASQAAQLKGMLHQFTLAEPGRVQQAVSLTPAGSSQARLA